MDRLVSPPTIDVSYVMQRMPHITHCHSPKKAKLFSENPRLGTDNLSQEFILFKGKEALIFEMIKHDRLCGMRS